MQISGDIVLYKEETLGEILTRIDARMGRIEGVLSEQQKQLDEQSRQINSLEVQVGLMTHLLYWGIGFISLLIVIAPAVWALLQKITRPAVTLEDIRRLIAEAKPSTPPQS